MDNNYRDEIQAESALAEQSYHQKEKDKILNYIKRQTLNDKFLLDMEKTHVLLDMKRYHMINTLKEMEENGMIKISLDEDLNICCKIMEGGK